MKISNSSMFKIIKKRFWEKAKHEETFLSRCLNPTQVKPSSFSVCCWTLEAAGCRVTCAAHSASHPLSREQPRARNDSHWDKHKEDYPIHSGRYIQMLFPIKPEHITVSSTPLTTRLILHISTTRSSSSPRSDAKSPPSVTIEPGTCHTRFTTSRREELFSLTLRSDI